MGSCSSGGPNKYSGMCLAETSDAAKEENLSKFRAQTFSLPNSECPNRSNYKYEVNDRSAASAVMSQSEPKATLANTSKSHRQLPTTSAASSQRSDHPSNPSDFASRRDDLSWMDSASRLEHQAKRSVAFKDVSAKSSDITVGSYPSTFDHTATSKMDSTGNQKQHRSQSRKWSAPVKPFERWPGEYSTCIVPPPNKTVYDALLSPRGRLDYSEDSSWMIDMNDQMKSSDQQCQRHPSSASATAAVTRNGYDSKYDVKATISSHALPASGLPTASACKSWSSTTSSNPTPVTNECPRNHKNNTSKRSVSVSNCLSTTLGGLTGADSSDQHRPRVVSSENNRTLAAASQRLLNLLASPMKPLNSRNDTSQTSSTTKYTTLNNSDVSSDDVTSTTPSDSAKQS